MRSFGNCDFQVSEQVEEPSSPGSEQHDPGARAGSEQQHESPVVGGAVIAASALRGYEGAPKSVSPFPELPQLRLGGSGHRRGSAVTDDPVAVGLPGREIRPGLRVGTQPEHPCPQVPRAEPRSRSARRRERRRRAQLMGALPQKQVR